MSGTCIEHDTYILKLFFDIFKVCNLSFQVIFVLACLFSRNLGSNYPSRLNLKNGNNAWDYACAELKLCMWNLSWSWMNKCSLVQRALGIKFWISSEFQSFQMNPKCSGLDNRVTSYGFWKFQVWKSVCRKISGSESEVAGHKITFPKESGCELDALERSACLELTNKILKFSNIHFLP